MHYKQGELYYCSDYPQCPYVVYFRGSHYINPAAQTAASPSAIEKLRARYPFITFNDHEPPASVQNGALRRQYYNAPAIAPAPSTFTNNGMFDRPESSLRKNQWFTLFFYQLDENNQKQPLEGLPYELKWGTSGITFMSGKTLADGRLAWEGDSHHLNYRVYYGEPKEGQYPLFAYLPLNKAEEIPFHVEPYGIVLRDQYDKAYASRPYEIHAAEHTLSGTTNSFGLVPFDPIEAQAGPLSEVIVTFWPYQDDPDYASRLQIQVGELKPASDPSGLQQRLANMDALTGPIDGDAGPLTQANTKALQYRQQLAVSGNVNTELSSWFDLNDNRV